MEKRFLVRHEAEKILLKEGEIGQTFAEFINELVSFSLKKKLTELEEFLLWQKVADTSDLALIQKIKIAYQYGKVFPAEQLLSDFNLFLAKAFRQFNQYILQNNLLPPSAFLEEIKQNSEEIVFPQVTLINFYLSEKEQQFWQFYAQKSNVFTETRLVTPKMTKAVFRDNPENIEQMAEIQYVIDQLEKVASEKQKIALFIPENTRKHFSYLIEKKSLEKITWIEKPLIEREDIFDTLILLEAFFHEFPGFINLPKLLLALNSRFIAFANKEIILKKLKSIPEKWITGEFLKNVVPFWELLPAIQKFWLFPDSLEKAQYLLEIFNLKDRFSFLSPLLAPEYILNLRQYLSFLKEKASHNKTINIFSYEPSFEANLAKIDATFTIIFLPFATENNLAFLNDPEKRAFFCGNFRQIYFSYSLFLENTRVFPLDFLDKISETLVPDPSPQFPLVSSLKARPQEILPLEKEERVFGGTKILIWQDECPFKAFLGCRLNLNPISPENNIFSLSSRNMGILIHKTLYDLWQFLKNSLTIKNLPTNILQDKINYFINLNFQKMEKERLLVPNFWQIEKEKIADFIFRYLQQEKLRDNFQIVGLEVKKSLAIHNLLINLCLDRIELDEKTQTKTIIDYKTGSGNYNEWQLKLYAISAPDCQNISIIRLNTYDPSIKEVFTNITDDDRQKWQKEIADLIAAFQKGEISLKPKNASVCRNCPFRRLCFS